MVKTKDAKPRILVSLPRCTGVGKKDKIAGLQRPAVYTLLIDTYAGREEVVRRFCLESYAMNRVLFALTLIIISTICGKISSAEWYQYNSVITLCTGSCASFASFELGSTINGSFQIDTEANGSFGDAQVNDFDLSVFNPGQPKTDPTGDITIDNPFSFVNDMTSAVSNGTMGTTNAANEINGGQLLIELFVPPLVMSEAYIIVDLATGRGQICIFYEIAGCIPGATEFAKFEGSFTFIDSDGDLISDDADNCVYRSNADQRDTDGDGHGNACDADLNNDCVINVVDLGLFKTVLSTSDADADFNNDGVVDETDLALVRAFFFFPPGLAGQGALCNSPLLGGEQ